jgi:hypothetical protein
LENADSVSGSDRSVAASVSNGLARSIFFITLR